eukprot:CAMPEP_0194346024 /NCGR_PEP_ID=MMETSP0171-20130528/105194_1 /TAXON_ID=218684 /ORGANISM="Corethron pennatum, Strain L29A3" /LENGTH=118 /DNA_ID=CAMNT_0039113095 /DNA_START=277 /DNA_END=633 /DNA_ORIENTATION=+
MCAHVFILVAFGDDQRIFNVVALGIISGEFHQGRQDLVRKEEQAEQTVIVWKFQHGGLTLRNDHGLVSPRLGFPVVSITALQYFFLQVFLFRPEQRTNGVPRQDVGGEDPRVVEVKAV